MKPEPGNIYEHRNGNLYRVLFLANEFGNSDYPVTVVYEGINNRNKYAETLDKFLEKMGFISDE